jgi:hypothetical protein
MQFIVIFGPPAVGKMAVGREIEAATGLRLFHNHMTIEPVLRFFPFGSEPFGRLVDGFRKRLFEEVARSDLPGLIFTFVWSLDDPNDTNFLQRTCRMFDDRGHRVAFVELAAELDARLVRNRSADRLSEKPSKRDLAASERNLLDLERFRLNTDGSIPLAYPHLRIDNTALSAKAVADRVIDALSLARIRREASA